MIKKLIISFLAILAILLFTFTKNETVEIKPGWPEINNVTKPWSRWWWMGGAVNKTDLSNVMQQYAEVGLGGLELTNIYGVKGYEEEFKNYTSPEWMDMLEYTLSEAKKLNLGIDLALASGWPFGGPWVSPEDACKYFASKQYSLKEGEKLKEKIEFIEKPMVRTVKKKVDISELSDPVSSNDNLQDLALDQIRFPRSLPLNVLMAYSNEGEKIDITSKVGNDGMLNWVTPKGECKIYAIFTGWHGKMVERAGPGGESDVIDHFSKQAIDNYLKHFDAAFKDYDVSGIRAYFNDSYEVDDARGMSDWTPEFFTEFKNRRGYDLKEYLPALLKQDTEEMNSRVYCDFRETLSELILDNYTIPWQKWSAENGKLIRNQAHGSPANILDLYAASDIPETEGRNITDYKYASSAAHVTGKKLASCEAATWLNEHFLSTLADVKHDIDNYFVGGINHIVYHGTTYSPKDDPWPGWMFYASVNFAPSNTWWDDFKTLNEYVTRTQSFLQKGTPDNDILLYFNMHDKWSIPGNHPLYHMYKDAHDMASHVLADSLLNSGYSFDFISDMQIHDLKVENNEIISGNAKYKIILLPEVNYIPISTFSKLIELAKNGATIIIQNNLPKDVAGFSHLEENQKAFNEMINSLKFTDEVNEIKLAIIGEGKIFVSNNLNEVLKKVEVNRETLVNEGLKFVRIKDGNTKVYFISNWGENKVDKYIPFSAIGKSAVLYNPMNGEYGQAKINSEQQVYLQLNKGESCILQVFGNEVDVKPYNYYEKIGDGIILNDGWKLNFISGGPELPDDVGNIELGSWTELEGDLYKMFSGTAQYSIEFEIPKQKAQNWKLSLGEVHESAIVKLNGEVIGTLIGAEYELIIRDELLLKSNKLEILVTNLMANRMIDMDKNKVKYKKFYNINFAANKRENFDENRDFTSERWEPLPSGLIGPVELIPIKNKEF